MNRLFGLCLLLCLALAGCGGGGIDGGSIGGGGNTGGGGNESPSVITVTLNPTSAAILVGTNYAFTASTAGTSNGNVTWSVQEGPRGGSITATGVYTSPPAPGIFHIIAAAQADPTKTAVATVTVADYVGVFSSAKESLFTARAFHTATLLSDGTVFFIGGGTFCCKAGPSLASSEIFDPNSSVFRPGASLSFSRVQHTSTIFDDGRALVVGGNGDNPDFMAGYPLPAELYDPLSAKFGKVGNLIEARREHTSTLLRNGKVLVAGGFSITESSYSTLASTEIYEPPAHSFFRAGNMLTARQNHTATLLSSGMVLITGGFVPCNPTLCYAPYVPNNAVASAEVYDPSDGKFASTGDMQVARHHHVATLLADGRVLIVGGTTVDVDGNYAPVAAVEIFDPSTATFSIVGNLIVARSSPTATLLGNGKVLIAGGTNDFLNNEGGTVFSSAELFDPNTGTSSLTGTMAVPRVGHTATLLLDGQILVVGGASGSTFWRSAEVFK